MGKLRIDGVIGLDVTAAMVANALDGDMDIIINSPGGSILEGFSIYNALKDHNGKINIQVDWAGSMASVIAMAGDEVVMRDKSSLMMIHRPWSGSIGRSEDLRSVADSLDKLEDMLVGIYMDRASIKESELRAMLQAETYLNAKEAKQYGLATKVGKPDGHMAMSMGGGVALDIMKLVAKLESDTIKPEIEQAASLSDLEGVLRDSGRLSRADTTALVSRVKALTHGDREVSKDASDVINLINQITVRI